MIAYNPAMPRPIDTLREKSDRLRAEIRALVMAYRDPRTPWYARVCAALVLAYALSPIDLIPDFIPVLGYLDDLVLIPLGITLTLRLMPPQVMQDAREKSYRRLDAPN
jgi:uncharacterized membrane protein YkvA (DUF1232 family)